MASLAGNDVKDFGAHSLNDADDFQTLLFLLQGQSLQAKMNAVLQSAVAV
jgi:hypothetical protein